MSPSLRGLSSCLFLPVLLVVGCSERALTNYERTDGGLDLAQGRPDAADFAVGVLDASLGDSSSPGSTGDLSGLGGVQCGMQTCDVGATCCLQLDPGGQGLESMCSDSGACPDGGVPAACDGPEDCTGAAPSCCVALSLGGGGQPEGGAECTASCPAAVSIGGMGGGGGKIATQLCHSANDCKNYSGTAPVLGQTAFDRCCGLPGVSFQVCAPGLLAAIGAGVTCD